MAPQGSPEWWLDTLSQRLMRRRPELDRLWDYYRGNPPLPVGAETSREAYRAFLKMARTNYAELIVEAVRDRMIPVGFRLEGDEAGEEAANRIWQANHLDADCSIVHRLSLAMRDAYVIVGPVDDVTGEPTITVEDPRQVITAHDPINRRRVRAALKSWRDEDAGLEYAYLYLLNNGRVEVHRAQRPLEILVATTDGQRMVSFGQGWEWVDETVDILPISRIPVVRFVNQPDATGEGRAEHEGVTDILDRINTMLLQRMVIAVMQAFRQRAIVPTSDMVDPLPKTDPETGEAINYDQIFAAGPDGFWELPPGWNIWESQQVDLQPILSAVRADVQDLAAVSRTPMHYLMPEGANQSAEGASLIREGNIAKVVDRRHTSGEGWETMLSLAFEWKNDQRWKRVDTETLWTPAEQYSLAQKGSAIAQAGQFLPFEALATEIMQWTPQQTKRYEAMRASDALFSDLNKPAAPTAKAPGNGQPAAPA